jgi:tetratricopeptide (TPR) repeat protein
MLWSPKRILARAPFLRYWAAAVVLLVGGAGCDEVRARRNIQEGNKKYQDSKYEEAVKLYDEALSSQPQLAIGWFNLGSAHFAIYQPGNDKPENVAHATAAANAFLKYVQMAPEDPDGRGMLIKVYKDSGNYEGVVKYYETQLEKDPNNLITISEIALAYVEAGKFDDGIKWYKRLIEVDPSNDGKGDTWYRIGTINFRRLNKHPEVAGVDRQRIADEGLSALAEARTLRPNHADTLTFTNLLYRERALASEASYARAIDTAAALVYEKQSRAMKAAQAASNPPGGTPAPDPKAPAPKK